MPLTDKEWFPQDLPKAITMVGYVLSPVISSAVCAGMYMTYNVFINVPVPLIESRENIARSTTMLEEPMQRTDKNNFDLPNQQQVPTTPNFRHLGQLRGSFGSSVGIGIFRTSWFCPIKTISPLLWCCCPSDFSGNSPAVSI